MIKSLTVDSAAKIQSIDRSKGDRSRKQTIALAGGRIGDSCWRPDENETGCILLDVRMPGLSGPALHCHLIELGSTLPILFLMGHVDVSAIVKAMKAGADDFLIKPLTSDKLLPAIERALARHQTALETKREFDVLRDRLATLTPRERQVFVLIVRDKMNRQVAHELGATERTIKAHRHSVIEKMKARSLV